MGSSLLLDAAASAIFSSFFTPAGFRMTGGFRSHAQLQDPVLATCVGHLQLELLLLLDPLGDHGTIRAWLVGVCRNVRTILTKDASNLAIKELGDYLEIWRVVLLVHGLASEMHEGVGP